MYAYIYIINYTSCGFFLTFQKALSLFFFKKNLFIALLSLNTFSVKHEEADFFTAYKCGKYF